MTSETFKKREEEIKVEDEQREATAADEALNYYWAPASQYQVGNFKEEVWSSGRVVKPEVPLRWDNHVLITSDKKKIAFVEGLPEFKSGEIKECDTLIEANRLTAAHNVKKAAITSDRAELTEMQQIKDG